MTQKEQNEKGSGGEGAEKDREFVTKRIAILCDKWQRRNVTILVLARSQWIIFYFSPGPLRQIVVIPFFFPVVFLCANFVFPPRAIIS